MSTIVRPIVPILDSYLENVEHSILPDFGEYLAFEFAGYPANLITGPCNYALSVVRLTSPVG